VATFDGNPAGAAGWVTAEDVGQAPGGGGAGGIGGGGSGQDMSFHNGPAGQPVPLGPTSEGVEAWFAVEPAGAIFLRLNFVKQNVRKRPYDARLGRQGAVRKRKEDVAEINGHKFISRQFYQIIRCALCGELLLNAAGSQCEDCRYTCHKKCAQKVVTKCISKSNAEAVSRSSTGLMSRDTDVHAGPRRGQDQAPHPAPLRAAHEHRRQLVLPLRLHPAAWPQERAQVHG
jgi:classical protein kinase C